MRKLLLVAVLAMACASEAPNAANIPSDKCDPACCYSCESFGSCWKIDGICRPSSQADCFSSENCVWNKKGCYYDMITQDCLSEPTGK